MWALLRRVLERVSVISRKERWTGYGVVSGYMSPLVTGRHILRGGFATSSPPRSIQTACVRARGAGRVCAHWTSLVASRWLRERVRWASGINLMLSLPPQMAPNAGPRDE